MTDVSHATVDGIDLTQMLSNIDTLQQKLDGLTPGSVSTSDFAALQTQVSTLADAIKALSATTASSVDHAALVALQAAEAADHQALAGVQNILANLAAVLGGHLDATLPAVGTAPAGSPTGDTSAPAKPAVTGQGVGGDSDPNVYPLEVPVVANGADIVIGSGKNVFELDAASSPGAAADPSQVCHINIILVRPDGTMQGVAADVPVTSFAGEGSPKQSIKVRGPWGSNPKFLITGSSKGSGMGGLFIGSANCDLVPLGISGVVNYAGAVITNESHTYISVAATTLTLTQAVNTPAGAAPAPALLAPLYQPLTTDFEGTGATINGSGHRLIYDKSILLPAVAGLTIKDVTVTGARLAAGLGGNGAGIRNSDNGIDFTCSNVELYGNDDGMLTFPANVTLLDCRFHGNGSAVEGVAMTHNAYIGGNKDTTFTAKNYQGSGATRAHDLKIRSGTANIDGISSTAGGQGRCIDMPDGGNLTVENGTLTIPAGAADRTVLGYGTESGSNPGRQVTLRNILLVNGADQATQIISGAYTPDAVLTLDGVTYKGIKPNLIGWGKIVGEMTAA